MTIGAGALRERLAFDRRVEADDGYGNAEADWVEQFAVSARVLPLKGSEAVMGARLAGRQPVIITVRASRQSRTIAADWRARDTRSGAVYAITAPAANMDENGVYLDVLATTGAAA